VGAALASAAAGAAPAAEAEGAAAEAAPALSLHRKNSKGLKLRKKSTIIASLMMPAIKQSVKMKKRNFSKNI
jgi:hypothetical protein